MKNNGSVSESISLDLNILFDLSEDVLCIVNASGFLERANQQLHEISGLSASELTGRTLKSIIHPEDHKNVCETLSGLTCGESKEFTARCIHKNSAGQLLFWKVKLSGGKFYISAKRNSHQFQGDGHSKRHLTGVAPVDSSSNSAEHRFSAMLKNSTDMLAILSPEGDYKYVSPTVKRILGMDAEFYMGKNAFSFIHPEDVGKLNPLFEDVLNNFKVELPPYRFISSDGKWHWLETVVTNLLDDPAIMGIVANSRDVTVERELESGLVKNLRRFKNFIDQNNDGSFTLNRDLKLISSNSVFKNTKGMPAGVDVGANLREVFPKIINSTFDREFNRAFQENIPVHFKEYSLSLNKWFEVSAYPFEDTLTVMIRDITKLKVQQLTLSLEKEVMEMSISCKFSLKETLNRLLTGIEQIYPGMTCSVLRLDAERKKIYSLSAPSLPKNYVDAINGLEIEQEALKETILLSDIQTHPYWKIYKHLVPEEFKACWSFPVINAGGDVLATFGVYHRSIKEPSTYELKALERVSTLLQVLIENSDNKKAIDASNERYRLTIQATSDSIWDLNIKTGQLYRGNGFGKYFDQEPGFELLESRKWEKNIHPDDAVRVEESLVSSLNNEETHYWTEEYRYLQKDGSFASVIDKGFIIRNRKKEAIRIVGALQDITEIKKNQDKLKQSEENYKSVFTNNPTPMWAYDLENHSFIMVNDAAIDLYGYTRTEFLKLNLFSVRAEEDHEKLTEKLNSVEFQQETRLHHESTHLKRDKTRIIVDVISHPVLINGRRCRLVAIQDITEKKKNRQEILDQNQRLKEIAHMSSHGTRRPLASILGLVSLFDKTNLQNPLNKELIQYLETSANDLDKVVHLIVEKTWQEGEITPGVT